MPRDNELAAAEELVRRQEAEARRLAAGGLYDPREEHDACGVGLVASIDGSSRREVVEATVNATCSSRIRATTASSSSTK